MSPRVANAEKRLRVSLLLDAYGELLTEKQRGFLRRYYEEDFSFGEIARETNVSRQAIFDSVKHGEAALENYERVLGLVAGASAGLPPRVALGVENGAHRARALADELRELGNVSPGGGSPRETMNVIAQKLDRLASDLETLGEESGDGDASEMPNRPSAGRSQSEAESPGTGNGAGVLLLGDGPEID